MDSKVIRKPFAKDSKMSIRHAKGVIESIRRLPKTGLLTQFLVNKGVPGETIQWLNTLSSKERARIRISTANSLDLLIRNPDAEHDFLKSAVHSGTMLVYPASGKPFPHVMSFKPGYGDEYAFFPKEYAGEKGIALAVDEFDFITSDSFSYTVLLPREKVTVIPNFPQSTAFRSLPNDALGPSGSVLEIHRNNEAAIATVCRSLRFPSERFSVFAMDSPSAEGRIMIELPADISTAEETSIVVRRDTPAPLPSANQEEKAEPKTPEPGDERERIRWETYQAMAGSGQPYTVMDFYQTFLEMCQRQGIPPKKE